MAAAAAVVLGVGLMSASAQAWSHGRETAPVPGSIRGRDTALAASFPGRDGRLVFESRPSTVCCDLYTMRPNGTRVRRLTDFTPQAAALMATWSPDSRHIVFRVQKPGHTFGPGEIWMMNANGTHQHPILSPARRYFTPSFSADGAHVVFTRCRADFSSCAVFQVDTSGHHLTEITDLGHTGIQDFDPRFSPDGRRLSFTRLARDSARGAVYTVRPDGGALRRVTPPRLHGFQADWAPSGHALAFASGCCGQEHQAIWRIRANGDGLTRLTHPGVNGDFKPCFSPSGTWIAFERLAPGRSLYSLYDLWVMRRNGTDAHLVRRKADHVAWGSAPTR
jgi:Tol biopolymer transport system component